MARSPIHLCADMDPECVLENVWSWIDPAPFSASVQRRGVHSFTVLSPQPPWSLSWPYRTIIPEVQNLVKRSCLAHVSWMAFSTIFLLVPANPFSSLLIYRHLRRAWAGGFRLHLRLWKQDLSLSPWAFGQAYNPWIPDLIRTFKFPSAGWQALLPRPYPPPPFSQSGSWFRRPQKGFFWKRVFTVENLESHKLLHFIDVKTEAQRIQGHLPKVI
jgi:hypothetical protein